MTVTDVPTPTSQEELGEILATREDIAGNGGDPEAMAQLIQNYANETARRDPDLSQQLEDMFDQRFGKLLRDDPELLSHLQRPPMVEQVGAGLPDDPRIYNKTAVGAGIKHNFEDLGQFLEMVHHFRPDGPKEMSPWAPQARSVRDIQQAYSSEIPAEGGLLIPEEFRAQLMQIRLEDEIIRPRATVIPMRSRTSRIPFVDDKNHTASTHGGIITYWKKEAGQLTASNAEFGAIELITKKHTAYSELPSELPEDATGFMTFFQEAYPRAMAWGRDVGFWEGDGTDEPNGVLDASNASKIEVTRAGASAIDFVDVLGIFARMLPQSLSRSVWVANLNTVPQVMTMELSTGSPAVMHSNFPDSPPMTLLGRPLIFTEKVPALGSAADVGLYDFSQYLIGDRQAATAATSTEFKFDTDELAFRIIERLDGKSWMTAAVTPKYGDSLSPFVTLAA